MLLAVWISRILLDCRIVFFSSLFQEDKPIKYNDAPPSTMYSLSLECIANTFAVFFCVRTYHLKKFVLWTSLLCPSILEGSLWSLCALCFANSSCSSFHSVHLWSYGGAFGDFPFVLPIWITFRDGNLSMNSALSKLWWENLMLTVADGSFSVWAQECLFWAYWIVPLARGFTVLSSGCSWKFRNAKRFLAKVLGKWFAKLTLATVTFSFPDSFHLPFPGRWGLVDRWVDERTEEDAINAENNTSFSVKFSARVFINVKWIHVWWQFWQVKYF